VGVAIVILSPVFLRELHKQMKEEKEMKNAVEESPKSENEKGAEE
jgi:hypothetical protein